MESEKSSKLENQPKIVTIKSTDTEECSKGENVNESVLNVGNNSGPKENEENDTEGEDHSDYSKEDSKTSASTATQKRNSPTFEAMAMTSSGSGTSSPTHTEREKQEQQREEDGEGTTEDTNEDDDEDAKASWESGVSNLTSSTFITVKMLVSNNMAGSIIGRAGETINEFQQQSSSRIKLGQSGDYYPGTSERACLVHGSLENVKTAATLLLKKLHDLQLQQIETQLGRKTPLDNAQEGDDTQPKDYNASNADDDEQKEHEEGASTKRISFSVRLLIPSAACGMLIGRSGSNIKKMKEASQVTSIRLASKEPDSSPNLHFSSESMAIASTSERILTISGNELGACISCVFLILNGFARHPDICRYGNNTTSYSKIPSSFHAHYNPNQMGYPVGTSPAGSISPMNQHRGGRPGSYLPSHRAQNSTRVRSSDSFIPVSSGRRNQQKMYPGVQNVHSPLAQPRVQPPHGYATVPGGSRQRQNVAAQDIQKQFCSETMSISDSMIGAILGKRGQTLNYFQNKSGTKIKISQRGEFVTGTTNRVVTISGPNSQCVASAKNLIRTQISRNTQERMASPVLTEDEP